MIENVTVLEIMAIDHIQADDFPTMVETENNQEDNSVE